MNKKERLETLKSLIQNIKNAPYISNYKHLIEINNSELNKIYKIAIELCMSEKDFTSLYRKNSNCPKYNKHYYHSTKQTFTPKKWVPTPTGKKLVFMFDKSYERYNYDNMPSQSRDNNGIYVGGGGENINTVRYPSKKRSKKVWAKFYNMFPLHAKEDNWDGQTSDRMK